MEILIMKTLIYLYGLKIDKPEFIGRFSGSAIQIRQKLISLQEGYCEDERPKIAHIKDANGNDALEAFSNADFSHIAFLIKHSKKLL